jgi:hypothetical protein
METTAALPTISVDITGARDCTELFERLEANRLTAHVEQVDGRCELEIRPALMSDNELRATVRRVLSTWLVERDPPLVLDESATSDYLLRPPAD